METILCVFFLAYFLLGYEDGLFLDRVLEILETHDPSDPLFLVWTPHNVHQPLQVPDAYLKKFDFITGISLFSHFTLVHFV